MKAKHAAHRRVGTFAFVFSFLYTPAFAGTLAFDFDTDGDPSTVESTIQAEVGALVEAFLVVNEVPAPGFRYLRGLEFGLDATGGLELHAMSVAGIDGVMANDGAKGIAAAPERAVPFAEFPSFVMRFVFEVVRPGTQEARVVPSTGWGTSRSGFVYFVSETEDGGIAMVDDPESVEGQIPARVNPSPTPVHRVSWGGIKAIF